jgi:dienelactone hydrolase
MRCPAPACLTFAGRKPILEGMTPRPIERSSGLALALFFGFIGIAPASDAAALDALLRRPILGTNQPLVEVQRFTERRVPDVPPARSAGQWDRLAKRMRRDLLDKVVFRGEAARWRRAKTRVDWLEGVEGGPGYRLRKVRYEALPGLWIPAVLYEPTHLSGKVPVVLNVNGHEGIGKSVPYKQLRCINLAKRGLVVLNPEWIGMGQLNGRDYQHYKMNQLDLCGASGVAPFYLAMSRAIDLLLAHPNADPKRLAVAGLSGGGWQTIFISSLDPRVTLCNPVAGYSSFRTRARHLEDLGDSEQTPCDLATVADYAHLTAMLAPRPALLTFNAKDNCCFGSGHALDPLLEAAAPIYQLHKRPQNLRSHINYDPGDHNFGPDNRQAFYRMLGDFFFPDDPAFDAIEVPYDAEVKAHSDLLVELPPDNATFNSLARALATTLPRQAALPEKESAAVRWQRRNRSKLAEVVRFAHPEAVAERAGTATNEGIRAVYWKLRMGDEWTVPAVELTGERATGTVIVIADGGKAAASAAIGPLLASGQRVGAVDPFYFGESRIRSRDHLFALLISAVGERPLGIQAGQVAATARWAAQRDGGKPVSLLALGPRSSLFALIAAAQEENAIDAVELRESLGSLKEVIEQNWAVNEKPELFCFGLLENFDVKHLAALVAPRPVRFVSPTARLKSELEDLPGWFRTVGEELPTGP